MNHYLLITLLLITASCLTMQALNDEKLLAVEKKNHEEVQLKRVERPKTGEMLEVENTTRSCVQIL